VAFQDVAHSLVAHLVPEVAERPGDAIVAPVAVFLRDANHQVFDVFIDSWSTRILAVPRSLELLRDQPAMPRQDGLRFHDARDFGEDLSTELLADLRERPALAIAQPSAGP